MSTYNQWQTDLATYLRTAAHKTEEQAKLVGAVLSQLQECFSSTSVVVTDEKAPSLFTAEKMKALLTAINEEYNVMYDSKFPNNFPKGAIVDAIGYMIRDFKQALQVKI